MSTNKNNCLEVKNLFKQYSLGEKNIPVLRGLEVTVKQGELVVIMGPSGSGKSTLLNCISGISLPDQGVISICDQVIDLHSQRQRTMLRRHQLGIVFQFFNLIPTLTVKENVGLPFLIAQSTDKQTDSKISSMIEAVGLSARITHYPYQLSGGEMQLVSIARALVHEPNLLLADEPTGNVNPHIGRSIMDILRQTTKLKNIGMLMVTHNPEHAAWADRICFIKDGIIVAQHDQDGDETSVKPIHEKLLTLGI